MANICLLKPKGAYLVFRSVPFSLTFHVLHRYIQREGKRWPQLLSSLQPAVNFSFILSLYFAVSRIVGSLPIVYPLGAGLLLGQTRDFKLRRDDRGRYHFDDWIKLPAGSKDVIAEHPPIGRMNASDESAAGCEFRTYISRREMTPGQVEIWQELVDLYSPVVVSELAECLLTETAIERFPLSKEAIDKNVEIFEKYAALCMSSRYQQTIFEPASGHMF